MADLHRKLQNISRNAPVGVALSGLDVALWDIRGKVGRKPLYRLPGGAETRSAIGARLCQAAALRIAGPRGA